MLSWTSKTFDYLEIAFEVTVCLPFYYRREGSTSLKRCNGKHIRFLLSRSKEEESPI